MCKVIATGALVVFKCECGYEACGKYGKGTNPIYRENNICLAPALCKDCRELVSINKNAVQLHCPGCKGINVVFYSDPSLTQVRRKSVIRRRWVYRGPGADLDIDDLMELDLERDDDGFESEQYIDGNDKTYYLCPKCNRFTMENWAWKNWY
jgi:phage FluMu protein Com